MLSWSVCRLLHIAVELVRFRMCVGRVSDCRLSLSRCLCLCLATAPPLAMRICGRGWLCESPPASTGLVRYWSNTDRTSLQNLNGAVNINWAAEQEEKSKKAAVDFVYAKSASSIVRLLVQSLVCLVRLRSRLEAPLPDCVLRSYFAPVRTPLPV